MLSGGHDRGRTSSIIHLPRPLRTLIRRVSFLVFIILAIWGIVASKKDSGFLLPTRVIISDAITPVTEIAAKPANFFSNIGDSITSYLLVRSKNQKLSEENKELKNQLIELSSMKYENQKLRKLLNYVQERNYKFITARVVGDTSGSFQNSILLNVGSKDHIKRGQVVVSEEGIVGRIMEVGEKTSKVFLITDINSRIPVISSKSRERGIMYGRNTANPELMYLPKDSKISNGEVLLTSGDDGYLPPGLQVGLVYSPEEAVFMVNPFVKLYRLENVSIIDYPE